jgi:hypothetical protein
VETLTEKLREREETRRQRARIRERGQQVAISTSMLRTGEQMHNLGRYLVFSLSKEKKSGGGGRQDTLSMNRRGDGQSFFETRRPPVAKGGRLDKLQKEAEEGQLKEQDFASSGIPSHRLPEVIRAIHL